MLCVQYIHKMKINYDLFTFDKVILHYVSQEITWENWWPYLAWPNLMEQRTYGISWYLVITSFLPSLVQCLPTCDAVNSPSCLWNCVYFLYIFCFWRCITVKCLRNRYIFPLNYIPVLHQKLRHFWERALDLSRVNLRKCTVESWNNLHFSNRVILLIAILKHPFL